MANTEKVARALVSGLPNMGLTRIAKVLLTPDEINRSHTTPKATDSPNDNYA
tara:strand:+ start:657 stop:812 length:156 start_codon:yes stop_codon:yes gene_type:complete